MINSTEMATRIKLKEVLDQQGLTPYAVAKASNGKVSKQGLYYILNAKTPLKSIDLETIDAVIESIETLTGNKLSVCDLLEYERV